MALSGVKRHFFGGSIVLLGAWEGSAYASAGKLPTVTRFVRRRWWTKAAAVAWLGGCSYHLLRRIEES